MSMASADHVPRHQHWPNKAASGAVSSELVCLTDVIATLADILESKLLAGAGPDSVSLLPVLLGRKTDKHRSRAVVHHDFAGRFAIRQGDWKFVAPFAKTRREVDRGAVLFNLKRDPTESNNVIGKDSDVAIRPAKLLVRIRAAN